MKIKGKNNSKVMNLVWYQVREQVSNQAMKKVDPSVRNQVWDPVVDQVWLQVRTPVCNQVENTYEEN